MATPMMITADLQAPIIGTLGPLDGPLAWAWVQHAQSQGLPLEDITPDYAPDFPLPLATWEHDGVWGWKVSRAVYEPEHYSTIEIRRRPAVGPMAMFTKAKEHHSGLGPMKAGNRALATDYAPTVTWYADVTDEDALRDLLQHVTHLGARHRNGFGKVVAWHIQPGPEDGWQDRPMPHPSGKLMRTRAPYWHPAERTTCV